MSAWLAVAGNVSTIEGLPSRVPGFVIRAKDSPTIYFAGDTALFGDMKMIAELYAPDWKMWFPEEGDPRHGTPEDPRFVLIGVRAHAAEFLEVNKPKPVVFYELVKGFLTGSEPDLGEMHELHEPRRPKS